MAKMKKTPDTISNQVYRTTNLEQFKILSGNRVVNVSKKLRDSIREHGVATPIKVNKKMEVIDGQHRLAVAKELNLPIDYEFDKTGISVAELNSTSKAWRLGDYIHQYATLGNMDYVRLANLLKNYPALRPKVAITQATGITNSGSNEVTEAKNGTFAFRNYTQFEKFARSYQNFIDRTGLKTNQQLQVIYFILYSLDAFNDERFIKKVITRGLSESLYGVTSLSRIMRALVEANNSSLTPKSNNWISISTDETGTITVMNSYNKALVPVIAPVQAK